MGEIELRIALVERTDRGGHRHERKIDDGDADGQDVHGRRTEGARGGKYRTR